MDQIAGPVYTQTTEDGFDIESSAPSDAEFAKQLGVSADEKPSVEAKPADVATDEEEAAAKPADKSAPDRDEQGRFKSKAGDEKVADEPAKSVEQPKVAKPKDDPQARIDQAIARQREAERRAEAAERRARELEESRTAPRRDEQPQAQARESQAHAWQRLKNHPDAPKADEFADYTDYTAALSHFVAVKTHEELQQAQQQAARQANFERQRHDIRSKAAASLHKAIAADAAFLDTADPAVVNLPTFDDLQPNQRPTVRHFIGEEIMRLGDNTAPMVRYLSEHPEEFQRLATLHPRDLTRQMAILETRLDAANPTGTVSQAPAISQAKPPVRPVTGSPLASDDAPDPDDDDLDRHMRHYNALDRKAGRRR